MFYEQLVENRLRELIPGVDCHGRDRKLYDTAREDLAYYLQIKWGFEEFSMLDFRNRFLECIGEEGQPVKVFIDNWLSGWYKKWKQRVKIILRDEHWTADKEQVTRMIKRGANLISHIDLKRYKQPLIEALINHGEIACTKVLAGQSVKRQLAARGLAPKTVEEKLNFLNVTMNRLIGVTKTTGPLVFIKLGKVYFKKW